MGPIYSMILSVCWGRGCGKERVSGSRGPGVFRFISSAIHTHINWGELDGLHEILGSHHCNYQDHRSVGRGAQKNPSKIRPWGFFLKVLPLRKRDTKGNFDLNQFMRLPRLVPSPYVVPRRKSFDPPP